MSLDLLEAHDPAAKVRNALRHAAHERGYWQGIPMPLDGERLVIEPSYPNAKELSSMGEVAGIPAEDEGYAVRNRFWSDRRMCEVLVFTNPAGKIEWGIVPGIRHLAYDIRTCGCSDAWGIEQEGAALATLAGLLPHHAMKRYLLTGMFFETSSRSGVIYLFRKLRPTVAIHNVNGEMRVLAALCLHPIAYYEGSWAGAMCPTDDVLAHLMLMRGDEAMFWRRANQHAAIRPEAGL